jgi:hypothetical protein
MEYPQNIPKDSLISFIKCRVFKGNNFENFNISENNIISVKVAKVGTINWQSPVSNGTFFFYFWKVSSKAMSRGQCLGSQVSISLCVWRHLKLHSKLSNNSLPSSSYIKGRGCPKIFFTTSLPSPLDSIFSIHPWHQEVSLLFFVNSYGMYEVNWWFSKPRKIFGASL